jgi:small-conductance mechanosensitive channel
MWEQGIVGFFRQAVGAFDWAPFWLPSVLAMAVLAATVLILYRTIIRVAIRLARSRPFMQSFIARSVIPTRVFLVLFVVVPLVPSAGFPDAATAIILRASLIIFILMLGWSCMTSVRLVVEAYLSRFRTDVDDNFTARKHITQFSLLRRVADSVIVLVTLSTALLMIPAVRQYGVSLFASAGVAGVILGLAARPLLTNLIAGLQIAITQPIRLEDAVVVEGEWGWIEEISTTYVLIRLWDLRRLVVPLSYFIERPFQNWTHHSATLVGSVYIYVDLRVPVQRLRDKLTELARSSTLWDGMTVVLQVTDVTKNGLLELRALVSARNATRSWDLRCEIREKLVAFLQEEYPDALPRARIELSRHHPGDHATDRK